MSNYGLMDRHGVELKEDDIVRIPEIRRGKEYRVFKTLDVMVMVHPIPPTNACYIAESRICIKTGEVKYGHQTDKP